MQPQLFAAADGQTFTIDNGGLRYYPRWLSEHQADVYFRQLQRQCTWQQSAIRIAGRMVKIPRLNAWYGDPGSDYRYSGRSFQPLPWIRPLRGLRQRLQAHLVQNDQQQSFNSALVNYYRDGQDSVAWHADDEPELGPSPVIASISLGETRRFLLKRRDGKDSLKLELEPGSLLLMLPPLQRHWVHALPKTKQVKAPRINVTFRQVIGQSWP